MNKPNFEYELLHIDRHCGARRSRLTTPRGIIELPCFMPVGTCGTVKGLTNDQLLEIGSQIILGNTYHLALRPGMEVIGAHGGLHDFSGWQRPILTDSGGFQFFSLAKLTKIDENGAVFRSHIDGSPMELTPEKCVEIQETIGSDIAMVLDHLIQLPSTRSEVEDACDRTTRWAKRSRDAQSRSSQIQFGIVQGGLDPELRKRSAAGLVELDFPGYAIGGLSVGETPEQMYQAIDCTAPELPTGKPRYLMGVGRPEDLLEAIMRGVDMFDCVMPTRNGRNGSAFTDDGPIKLKNLKHRFDKSPIDDKMTYRNSHLSRSYLRHLVMAGEMLGPILLSLHNLAYYHELMTQARMAIETDCYLDFYKEKMAGWTPN